MPIITRIFGGLGNQIFQYTAGRALARHLNTDLWVDRYKIDTNYEGKETFFINHKPVARRRYSIDNFVTKITTVCHLIKPDESKIFTEKRNYTITENFFDLPDNSILHGDWCHPYYFDFIKDEWLASFSVTTRQISAQTQEIINRVQKNNWVFVHVRRGDFVDLSWALDISYYQKAFAIIREKISQPSFFIFSDDVKFAFDWFKQQGCLVKGDQIGMVPTDSMEDWEEWLVMSFFKYGIISNSSFSLTAGLTLSLRHPNHVIIAPINKGNDKIMLPSWIGVEGITARK